MQGITSLQMRLDRVRFAQAACPGYTFDPWQILALRSQHPRLSLNIHRQGGKSLVCALISLHTALYEDDSPILMVSPSLRQSSELFRVTIGLYRALGRPVKSDVENKLSLELSNNSRIISLPGHESTIRGISRARLIVADEGSRVPDALMAAVRPMLSISSGRLISPSTPMGRRGWWYEAWENGGDTWERYMVKAEACPRISKEFLDEEFHALGPSAYAREYECSFDDSETAVFPEELIQRVITRETSSWKTLIPPPSWASPIPA